MMDLELWVVLAIGAALAQTVRNSVAQSVASRIPAVLNSWARFTFCLPWTALACLIVVLQLGMPRLPLVFFAYCVATALTQLLGNVALIAAFRAGGFGEAIVFHKLEVLLTAIAGALFFGETPSALGTLGIVICAAGVLLVNLRRESENLRWTRALQLGRSGMLALLCAALLVGASFALKAANAVITQANPAIAPGDIAAPIQTLFHTTWIEVALLTLWIARREPASFAKVAVHWQRMAWIGSTSFIASLGWFWAFSLTLVAYVKAVGQIEVLFAVALGIRVLREKGLVRQLPGIAFVMAGIVLVLLG